MLLCINNLGLYNYKYNLSNVNNALFNLILGISILEDACCDVAHGTVKHYQATYWKMCMEPLPALLCIHSFSSSNTWTVTLTEAGVLCYIHYML